MSEKKNSNQGPNKRNAMWWNPFDLVEAFEEKSIQAIENQKEWVHGTREQFNQLEENSKKLTTEWKANTQTFVTENKKELGVQGDQEWLNKLEDIGHKSQQIAFLPGKTSLDILLKSTEQFEETFVNRTTQNKKIREETTDAFDGVFDQIKQTQKEMFQFFRFNPSASK